MESIALQYDSGSVYACRDRSRRVLLRDVAFSMEAGETLAVIGETGSGKTMLARSIMGLLPENVKMEGGRVILDGQLLASGRQRECLLGSDMVYIPQNGWEFLDPSRSIRRQLYDSLKKNGVPRGNLAALAAEKLALAGLPQPETLLDKYVFQLSGGMAQRVTIALAACAQPKLLIADEPTNGLDYEAKCRFLSRLEQLFPQAAKLIITHDFQVARLCRNTLVLCGGRIMEKGPSALLLEQPRHPYTQALLDALVENGLKPTPLLRQGEAACPFYRRCDRAQELCRRELRRQQQDNVEWWCSREV